PVRTRPASYVSSMWYSCSAFRLRAMDLRPVSLGTGPSSRRVERVLERTIQSTATAAAASREIQVTGQEIQSIGSTYEPSTITSKWRWQPVEDPVVPAMAT